MPAKSQHSLSVFAALTATLLLGGCTTVQSTPTDAAGVRAIAEDELASLSHAMESEDFLRASQPISTLFTLGPSVALRYSDTAWPIDNSGGNAGNPSRGVGVFRQFFAAAFEINANIEQSFEIEVFTVNGDVATAEVSSEFTAVRLDKTPPESRNSAASDLFVFQREGGGWRITRWDEPGAVVPPPPEE